MNAVSVAVKYSLDPKYAPGALQQQQRFERFAAAREACTRLYEEALQHACQGREAEAQRCYRQAFVTEPNTYRRICGAQWVETGDYAQGWALIAERGDTNWDAPRWKGQKVGTLVVSPSGGLGDQILFARYAQALKAHADRVVLLTPKPLTRLFRRIADVFEIDRIPNGQISFNYPGRPDAWIDMDALPHLLGTRMESIPLEPYISAYPADIERWRAQLLQEGLRVGIVWRTCATAREPHRRSLPSLSALAPLWQVPGVSFVSLQRGDGEDEARSCPLPLTLVDDRDMADAAAVIASLDLVIGTDVAITNLAGAVGKPTWVLAEPYPNFRWRHGWYKGGRLFCQKTNGDWSSPVQDAAAALAELVKGRQK